MSERIPFYVGVLALVLVHTLCKHSLSFRHSPYRRTSFPVSLLFSYLSRSRGQEEERPWERGLQASTKDWPFGERQWSLGARPFRPSVEKEIKNREDIIQGSPEGEESEDVVVERVKPGTDP